MKGDVVKGVAKNQMYYHKLPFTSYILTLINSDAEGILPFLSPPEFRCLGTRMMPRQNQMTDTAALFRSLGS